MNPLRLRFFTRLPGFCLTGSLLASGCSTPLVSVSPPVQVSPGEQIAAPAPVHTSAKLALDTLPALDMLPAPEKIAKPADVSKRLLPISLDTVLRLAEEQNVQVSLSREKLAESQSEQEIANLSWLPNIHVGMAYYRHEGGIQDQDGTFLRSSMGALWPGMDVKAIVDVRDTMYQKVNAERKVWQQQGELSRVTSENLLEAANAYIDLLAARTGESVLKRIETLELDVLKWVEALFKQEKSAEILVETVKAQLSGRRQAINQARQQAEAASAKLAYLLGLGPDVQLVPADANLQPIELADARLPTEALVNQALASGPGVQELEQMIAVIQEGLDRANSKGRFLPVFEMCMREGAFGAGPNSNLTWDNRWETGVNFHWNLTELLTANPKMAVAQSKLQQAELGYRDLQGKLTMGVQEAQSTILGSKDVIKLGSEQVQHAEKSHKLSDLRLKQRVEGGSTTEVLGAIRALEMANLSSLNAIRAHNKAQVRLMILMGAAGVHEHKGLGEHKKK